MGNICLIGRNKENILYAIMSLLLGRVRKKQRLPLFHHRRHSRLSLAGVLLQVASRPELAATSGSGRGLARAPGRRRRRWRRRRKRRRRRRRGRAAAVGIDWRQRGMAAAVDELTVEPVLNYSRTNQLGKNTSLSSGISTHVGWEKL